jgi:hypothetical protein
MQVGDPKKALVLAIVAIAILCVAAFQLFPKAKSLATAQLRNSSSVAAATADVHNPQPLPETLTADPFGRPKGPGTKPAGAPPDPGAPGEAVPHALGKERSFAPYRPGVEPIPPMEGTLPPRIGQDGLPEKFTGLSRESKEEHKVAVTLNAILRIQRRFAVLTVDGNEQPLKCETGAVVKGYKVIGLSDTQITLQKDNNKIHLTVGSTAQL